MPVLMWEQMSCTCELLLWKCKKNHFVYRVQEDDGLTLLCPSYILIAVAEFVHSKTMDFRAHLSCAQCFYHLYPNHNKRIRHLTIRLRGENFRKYLCIRVYIVAFIASNNNLIIFVDVCNGTGAKQYRGSWALREYGFKCWESECILCGCELERESP